MLRLKEICKEYRTGGLVQNALDHVSLSLRPSEFVAILGPSGSGKTTLLNVIGGLDRYDSGELLINGISTSRYRDRDWDAYRNHTVGFVFQSYNLIPHQTVLANVELALTISGAGRVQRRARAVHALEQVGLGDHLHKKPSQLSGGQMQRVAIARAMVNDPDILLADEPTGALDSATSVQVMDLLKEVARDRLVVMVTHNPELAAQYATRIITLRDGRIQDDSHPFLPEEELPPAAGTMGRASMSPLTALSLSFDNLRTKKARTILTAFAGSIGIIGISLILALSSGVNTYIQQVERDTLSGYPVELQRAGFDLTSMLDHASGGEVPEEGQVGVLQRVTDLFSTLDSNDLKAFKAFLDSGESGVEPYAAGVEYGYDLAPQIYRIEGQGVRQVHPDQSFADLGLGSSVSASGVMSGMMSTDVFSQLPESTALYREQYALKAGRWPESSQECVLVLTAGGSVSDLTLYTLGLRDAGELEQMVQQFLHEEDVDTPETLGTYGYDDILGITFQVVSSSDYYQYDSEYQVWRDKRDDLAYMQDLVEAGEPLTVVGIVQPTGDSGGQLQSGLAYPASLTHHMAELAAGSQIVQEQLAQPDINIFTNEPFGQESGESGFSLSSLFHIDQAALEELFTLDQQALADNLTGALSLDMEGLRLEDLNLESGVQWEELLTDLPQPDLAQLLEGVQFQVTEEGLNGLAAGLMTGWQDYVATNPQADYSELGPSFLAFLRTEEGSRLLSGEVEQILSANGISAPGPKEVEALVNRLLTGFLTYCGEKHPEWFDPEGEPQLDLLLPAGLSEYLATGEAQEIMAQWTAQAFPTQGLTITQEQMEGLAAALSQGYGAYAEAEGLPDPTQMGRYFADYLGTETAQSLLAQAAASMVDASGLQTQLAGALASYGQTLGENVYQKLVYTVSSAMESAADQLALRLQSSLTAGMETLGANLTETFRLTPDALAEVVSVTMDAGELSELLRSMSAAQGASYEGNLEALDYVDFDNPSSIRIYPLDFESKAKITGILEDYNHHMEEEGREEQVITYSDVVGALMSSVTDIIDIVSQVLIAFVALSLVVSSIMIGVITYISVLERRKEIGILRAIGASRRNISQVFTAETFIIGLGAGLIGVGFTLLVLIPGNALIHQLAGTDQINAFLPVGGAVILVLLSVLLTLLSGLLPASKAAKSDPVAALRSD